MIFAKTNIHTTNIDLLYSSRNISNVNNLGIRVYTEIKQNRSFSENGETYKVFYFPGQSYVIVEKKLYTKTT